MTNLLKLYLRMISDLLILIIVPFAIIVVFATPIIGLMFPSENASRALDSYTSGFPLMIGGSYEKHTSSGRTTFLEHRRIYVDFPVVLTNLNAYEFEESHDAEPKVNVRELGFLAYIIGYVFLAAVFLFFTVPRFKKLLKSKGFRGIFGGIKIRFR